MTLVLSDSFQELFYPFFPWIVKEMTRISFFDNDASIHKNNLGGHIPGKPDLVCYHDVVIPSDATCLIVSSTSPTSSGNGVKNVSANRFSFIAS